MKSVSFIIILLLFLTGCSNIKDTESPKGNLKKAYSSIQDKKTYKEENKNTNIDDYYKEIKDIIEDYKGEEGFIKFKFQEETYVVAFTNEKNDESYFKIGEVLDRGEEVCINLIKEKKSNSKEEKDISSFTIVKLPKDFSSVTVVTDEGITLKDIVLKNNKKYPQP